MKSKPKNKFVTLGPAETAKFREAVAPVAKRFADEVDKQGGNGAKVIADAKALVDKYSK